MAGRDMGRDSQPGAPGRWWLAGAVAGVGGACAVVAFALTAFASSGDLARVEAAGAANAARLTAGEERAARAEERQVADVEARRRLEAEVQLVKQQAWEIARAVGARVVVRPSH